MPEGIQDKTEVEAPPSVDKTCPAEPSATGKRYVTALVVELDDLIVVELAEVLPKTKLPWVVEAKPKVKLPVLSKEVSMLVPSDTVRALPDPAWETTIAAPVAEALLWVTPRIIPESVPVAELMLDVNCNAAAESVLVPVTTVRFKNTSGVESLAEMVPVRLIWKSDVVTAAVASSAAMIDPVPFGFKVKLPLAPEAMVKAPESAMLLADNVWVEPLMIKPLMVLVEVAAVIAPSLLMFQALEVPEISFPVPELEMVKTSPEPDA